MGAQRSGTIAQSRPKTLWRKYVPVTHRMKKRVQGESLGQDVAKSAKRKKTSQGTAEILHSEKERKTLKAKKQSADSGRSSGSRPSSQAEAVTEPPARKKQKPSKKEAEPDVPQSTTDGTLLSDTQRRSRKRKRKTVAEADKEVSEEERQRRQRQRELRELALKVRAEGKKYEQPPKRPAPNESTPKAAKKAALSKRAVAKEREAGLRPEHPVEVIVVPITWKFRPVEKAGVIQTAGKAMKLLEAAGVKIGMDTTESMTPGQKFGYWEGEGVMVRIECGPTDVLRQRCVLAMSTKAGEVAKKQTIEIGAKLVHAVGKALGRELDVPPSDEAEPMDIDEQQRPKRVAISSGDDLGGDFGNEIVADEAIGNKKKKRRKF